MKKLLLLTILIGGCATTVPQFETKAYEREGKCKIDYRNQYWGDCYIRAAKADPNFLKVSAFIKKNYPNSNMQYNLLQYLNDDLVKRLAGNEITVDEANKSFQKKKISIGSTKIIPGLWAKAGFKSFYTNYNIKLY